MAINVNDKYKIRFQADWHYHGCNADVIVKEDVTLLEAIEFLNSKGIECFCLGGSGRKNRISVGGGTLRRLGWYDSDEYAEFESRGKVEVTQPGEVETGD